MVAAKGKTPKTIIVDGVAKSVKELAKDCGVKPGTMYARYRRGMRGEKLWDAKADHHGNRPHTFLEVNGERHTVKQWSKITGKSQSTIYARMNLGITGAAIFEGYIPRPRPQKKPQEAYTVDELYTLYHYFAGQPDELLILADLMGCTQREARATLQSLQARKKGLEHDL